MAMDVGREIILKNDRGYFSIPPAARSTFTR
jgi:hypothetical protein